MYRSWDNFRILHKIDTEEAWSSSTLILKKGEIALSVQSNNSVQMKIGDGASTYSELPFKFVDSSTVTELIKNAIPTLTGDVTSTSEYDEVSGNVKLVTSVVDNSHNHTISNITSLQDELDKKAPINNPAFTGVPTAPTAAANTNSNQIASTKYVDTAVANKNNITGNAGTANKLKTARKIELTGDVTGFANFDGSRNINIQTTLAGSYVTESDVISLILALS